MLWFGICIVLDVWERIVYIMVLVCDDVLVFD